MEDGWRALGHRVASQRARHGWTVEDLAARMGRSKRTVEYIEAGSRRNYSTTTLSRIDTAFGWRGGSAERTVEGMWVREEADPLLARLHDAWPNLSSDQQLTIVTLIEILVRERS